MRVTTETRHWTWSADNVRPLTHEELEQLRDMMPPTRSLIGTLAPDVAGVYTPDGDAVTETGADDERRDE